MILYCVSLEFQLPSGVRQALDRQLLKDIHQIQKTSNCFIRNITKMAPPPNSVVDVKTNRETVHEIDGTTLMKMKRNGTAKRKPKRPIVIKSIPKRLPLLLGHRHCKTILARNVYHTTPNIYCIPCTEAVERDG